MTSSIWCVLQHAALIGGANSQSCPVCHKICLNAEALMDHMRTAHKDPNASGTPSKKKRGRSRFRTTDIVNFSSSASIIRNNTGIISPNPNSLHQQSQPTHPKTSPSPTTATPYVSSMTMGPFVVPQVVGGQYPLATSHHRLGPQSHPHYPYHPLAARTQPPSFLSL